MEKEGHQPESLSTVTIKPDYAPSETYSSEPPPAYHRPKSTTVQVAKIISFTIIAVSVIIGCFILASAYVTANASCNQLQQEIQFLTETADRMQPLQPEALIQEEQQSNQDLAKLDQKIKEIKEIDDVSDNKIPNEKMESTSTTDASSEESDEEEKTIHIKMPLELDFDDLAGALMEKNQRSRMNCIVEKKRAEQVVDHQPKTIQLPFGLNLTTDPRFEHLSGERMAIFCESGNDQSHQEPEQDDQEETIMIQPIMIPIPHTNFQTHMPMQVQPHIMPHDIPNRMPIQEQQQHFIPPPHPMETMRPPMPMPMMQNQQHQQQEQSEPDFPPIQMLHRIAQQIIAQKIQMEQSRNQDENQSNEVTQSDDDQHEEGQHYPQSNFVMAQRFPVPEEILSQINRLPNNNVVIAVSNQEQDDQSEEQSEGQQQVDSNDDNMNVRIGFARQLSDNVPLRMVQVQPETQPLATDEMRPHYVHPRSVRSVDNILPKSVKRVKRCSCDCAC